MIKKNNNEKNACKYIVYMIMKNTISLKVHDEIYHNCTIQKFCKLKILNSRFKWSFHQFQHGSPFITTNMFNIMKIKDVTIIIWKNSLYENNIELRIFLSI